MTRPLFGFGLLVLIALMLFSCAGSLSPLYRDFKAPEVEDQVLLERIAEAVTTAGWEVGNPSAPNVVSTEIRILRRWGLYRVEVALDVLPVGSGFVRVIFHPYRRFIFGGRSKVQYLSGGVRRIALPDLADALEAQGLELLGTPIERDRKGTKERIR